MKRWRTAAVAALAAIQLWACSGEEDLTAKTVSVIGGAEGPASIFLAGKQELADLEAAVDSYIQSQVSDEAGEEITAAAHRILRQETEGQETVLCLCFQYSGFTLGTLEQVSEKSGLAKMTLRQNKEQEYELEGWVESGEEGPEAFAAAEFPEEIQEEAIKAGENYARELEEECRKKAEDTAALISRPIPESVGRSLQPQTKGGFLEPTTEADGGTPELIEPTTQAVEEESLLPLEESEGQQGASRTN